MGGNPSPPHRAPNWGMISGEPGLLPSCRQKWISFVVETKSEVILPSSVLLNQNSSKEYKTCKQFRTASTLDKKRLDNLPTTNQFIVQT
jgi:hypothetical protein